MCLGNTSLPLPRSIYYPSPSSVKQEKGDYGNPSLSYFPLMLFYVRCSVSFSLLYFTHTARKDVWYKALNTREPALAWRWTQAMGIKKDDTTSFEQNRLRRHCWSREEKQTSKGHQIMQKGLMCEICQLCTADRTCVRWFGGVKIWVHSRTKRMWKKRPSGGDLKNVENK